MKINKLINIFFRLNTILTVFFLCSYKNEADNNITNANIKLVNLYNNTSVIEKLIVEKKYMEAKKVKNIEELLEFARKVDNSLYHLQIELSGRTMDVALQKDKCVMFLLYYEDINTIKGFYYILNNNLYYIDCGHYIDYGNKFTGFNNIRYINKLNNKLQFKQRIGLYNLNVTHEAFSDIDNKTLYISYIVSKTNKSLRLSRETTLKNIEEFFSYTTHPICSYQIQNSKNFEAY